jgi:hypothetical protein
MICFDWISVFISPYGQVKRVQVVSQVYTVHLQHVSTII